MGNCVRSRASALAAAVVFSGAPLVAHGATTLLDLQSNYSTSQLGTDNVGDHNQQYGYFDFLTYQTQSTGTLPMTNNGQSGAANAWAGGSGTSITKTTSTSGLDSGYPVFAIHVWQDGYSNNAAVGGEDGIVTISGDISAPTADATKGVDFRIILNNGLNSPIYETEVLPSSGTVHFSIPVTLATGDYVNFALGPGNGQTGAAYTSSGGWVNGTANLEATVVLPEPASLGLGCLALPLLLRRRSR